jgi:hypothetical protein
LAPSSLPDHLLKRCRSHRGRTATGDPPSHLVQHSEQELHAVQVEAGLGGRVSDEGQAADMLFLLLDAALAFAHAPCRLIPEVGDVWLGPLRAGGGHDCE